MPHPALTSALTVISNQVTRETPDKQRLIAAKCRGLMVGYHARWGEPDFEILSVENTVTADLFNPATQARSRTFTVAGKLDLVAIRNDRRTKTGTAPESGLALLRWRLPKARRVRIAFTFSTAV